MSIGNIGKGPEQINRASDFSRIRLNVEQNVAKMEDTISIGGKEDSAPLLIKPGVMGKADKPGVGEKIHDFLQSRGMKIAMMSALTLTTLAGTIALAGCSPGTTTPPPQQDTEVVEELPAGELQEMKITPQGIEAGHGVVIGPNGEIGLDVSKDSGIKEVVEVARWKPRETETKTHTDSDGKETKEEVEVTTPYEDIWNKLGHMEGHNKIQVDAPGPWNETTITRQSDGSIKIDPPGMMNDITIRQTANGVEIDPTGAWNETNITRQADGSIKIDPYGAWNDTVVSQQKDGSIKIDPYGAWNDTTIKFNKDGSVKIDPYGSWNETTITRQGDKTIEVDPYGAWNNTTISLQQDGSIKIDPAGSWNDTTISRDKDGSVLINPAGSWNDTRITFDQ